MSNRIEQRLKEEGITINQPAQPVASYVGYSVYQQQVIISGQLPIKDGIIPDAYQGKLGKERTVEQAKEAARQCAVNLLAQLKSACDGDFLRVDRCLRLGIFVQSTETFSEQHLVANGASNLIGSILGDKGIHARAAVGVTQLPLNACVEVEGLFSLRP